jgi:hypothetical protein
MSARPKRKITRRNLCKIVLCFVYLSAVAALVACGNSSGSSSSGPPAQMGDATGSGQSANVGTAFPNPFTATVQDSKNNPVSGAAVTFTAPSSGASGTFANGKTSEIDTTNSSGVATSSKFTANSVVSQSAYNVTASVAGVSNTLTYSLQNLPAATVTAGQGYAQGTLIDTQFSTPLQVTIILENKYQSGVSVTFTAPSSGASGTFATSPPSTTATVTTDQNGLATAPAFTANGTAGVYQVTATAADSPTPATFDLINVSSTSSPFAAGNYVFSLSGTDANNSFYSLAGVFTIDANGLIAASGGYQTFSDLTYTQSYEPIKGGGALVRTSDGNVRIILNTGDTMLGVGGSGEETFDAATVSGSKAYLIEFDQWATASGELDAQTLPSTMDTPCSTMPCSYAFLTSSGGPQTPFAMGGIFTVASAETISGGILDTNDNNSGTAYQSVAISGGSFTEINSFGALKFTLNLTAFRLAPAVVFDGYVIDSNHIRLVALGGFDVAAGGVALVQTGTTLGDVCTSGASYVMGLNGNGHGGPNDNGRLQVAGLFTMPNGSSGSLGGVINYNDLTATTTQEPLTIDGGTCVPDTTFLGRVSVNVTIQNSHVNPNLQMYVTDDSDGDVLALSLDPTDTVAGHGFQQTGGGSFTSASLSGNYAIDASGVNQITSSLTSEDEFDAVGTIVPNGSGAISANSSMDLNWLFNTGPTTGLSVSSGSYTTNANGVFTGTLTGLDAASSSTSDAFAFYLVDTTRAIAIETDTNQLSLDFLEQQQK